MTVNGLGADKKPKFVYVVVCDDDPIILLSFRHMLKKILPQEGIEVLSANNGNQAFSLIETISRKDDHKIVLLITDWRMPDLYGDVLLKRVHEKFPWIRLIMISAFKSKDAEMHLEGIPHLYLTKPVHESILRAAIETVMVEAHLSLEDKQ